MRYVDAAIHNIITQSSLEIISVGQIHCNSCGVMLGFIDSTREDIYDYITLCPNCIAKAYHAPQTKNRSLQFMKA